MVRRLVLFLGLLLALPAWGVDTAGKFRGADANPLNASDVKGTYYVSTSAAIDHANPLTAGSATYVFAAKGTSPGTVHFPHVSGSATTVYAFSAGFTVPDNTTLILDRGVKLEVAGTVTGGSNVTIFGYGAELENTATANVDTLIFSDETDVAVYGLEVDGKKSTKAMGTLSSGRGIHFHGVTRGKIRDCRVHDAVEHGIRVGSDSVQDAASSDIEILNNSVYDNGRHDTTESVDRGLGIWFFWRVSDFRVSGNTVYGNRVGGVQTDDASSDGTADKMCRRFQITDNRILNNNGAETGPNSLDCRGLIIEGSLDFTVTGNIITGHSYGIQIYDGQGRADTGYGIIAGNTIRGENYGVRIVNGQAITLEANDIEATSTTNSSAAGIEVASTDDIHPASDIHIKGGSVRGYFRGLVTTHTAYTGTTLGLYVEGVDFLGTKATAPTSGFGAQISLVTGFSIKGGRAENFYTGYAIATTGAAGSIEGVIAKGNANYGVQISGPARVRNCATTGNTAAGLRVDAGANDAATLLQGNDVSSDSYSGTITTTVRRGNHGLPNSLKGAAANVADGGTIAHGYGSSPNVALAVGSVAGEIVSVTARDATAITIAIKKPDGSAGTTQTIYWSVE